MYILDTDHLSNFVGWVERQRNPTHDTPKTAKFSATKLTPQLVLGDYNFDYN